MSLNTLIKSTLCSPAGLKISKFQLMWLRITHMSRECRMTWSCTGMNWIISRPISSEPISPVLFPKLTWIYSIGYMIMLFPSCILVSYIGPSIWLPMCEVNSLDTLHLIFYNLTAKQVLWGVFTCCLSTVTRAEQVGHINPTTIHCYWHHLGIRPALSHRVLWRRRLAGLLYRH